MTISWLGFNYFKVQNTQRTLLFNPYGLDKKTKFYKSKADLVLFTDSTKVASTSVDSNALVIDSPGEYEASNIFVYGRQVRKDNNIYLVTLDDIKIAFLGEYNHQELSNGDAELIEGADILILPVGGGELSTAKEANKIISRVEPRVVIPSCHSAGSGKLKTDSVTDFVKEFGVKPEEMDKFKVKKSDLPQEEVKLIVLKALK